MGRRETQSSIVSFTFGCVNTYKLKMSRILIMRSSDSESVSFNPKTIATLLTILAVIVGFIVWIQGVSATTQQNDKQVTHHDQEIEALKSQLNELKLQLSVIQEQNAQMKLTLNEVRRDVATIKDQIR
jgi:ribosomal protein L29